jgi:twitching motility protein PilJ
MEKTTHEVVGGSQLANDAGRQLSQIEAISSEITQLVRDILATTNQQAERSETVTRKVTGVAEFTTHTAVSAKQVESSVRQLASLAQHLNDSMSHFKLPENEEHSAAA